ncbi:MAG TPA: plastocyanin/azurin family copper-binding protein [Acidimicrobiia bacterium]
MFRRIPFVVLGASLGVGLVAAACSGDDGGGSAVPNPTIPGAPTLEVVGNNLSFEPDELEVAAGDFNVTLESVDQFHDFNIEDVDGIVEASAGETETAGFTIDEPDEYTFFCSVPGHRAAGMEGTLTVTE